MVCKISVIIPAYNAEKYLSQAVQSVVEQLPTAEREIIVIDDGSTDQTCAVAHRLGCMVLEQSHNGAAAARNRGIQAATGCYILLLDADDILTPGAVMALKTPFSMQPAPVAVFAKAMDFISPELLPEQAQSLRPRLNGYEGVLPGCSLIARETFQQVGLFDIRLKSAETVDWMMRLRAAHLPTLNIDFITLNRRLHLTNTGRVQAQTEMKNYAALLRKRLKRL